jgi:hypothetical protein
MAFAGVPGSISFAAAESGGAIIDFDAISGAGAGTGAAGVAGAADETVAAAAAACSGAAASGRGFSDAGTAVVATGDATGAGDGLCGVD